MILLCSNTIGGFSVPLDRASPAATAPVPLFRTSHRAGPPTASSLTYFHPCTYLQEDQFCDEFHLVDLRLFENCKKVCEGCDHVFNLAADMGGMGFIQSNHSVILYNNTMISYNMMEAARQNGVSR
jgi:hypothetical protein